MSGWSSPSGDASTHGRDPFLFAATAASRRPQMSSLAPLRAVLEARQQGGDRDAVCVPAVPRHA